MNLKYVANIENLVGCDFFEYTDGNAKGVRCCKMFNGVFEINVILDKAMNIGRATHCGENFSYVTKNGVVSPMLANTDAVPFLQSFDGGLLYTCGLSNIGAPKDGQIQHGRISNSVAKNVHLERSGEFGEIITLVGEIAETGLFTQNLLLTRRITMKLNDNNIEIEDVVKNRGFDSANYVLLYHFNLGYPLINENTTLKIEDCVVEGVNDISKTDLQNCFQMEKPTVGYEERVYIHSVSKQQQNAVVNNGKKALTLSYDGEKLPYLVEWKSMAAQDYVLGVEPSTSKFNEDLKLKEIAPQSEVSFKINIKID